jgi:starch synthase
VVLTLQGRDVRDSSSADILAAAARVADAVTAPSPTVASDLGDPARHGALADALGARVAGATGILGGLDYAVWNPATDAALRSRYDAEDPSSKGSTKADVLKRAGLDFSIERPFVVLMVEDEAGANLAEQAVPELSRMDVALLIAVRAEARSAGERLAERIEKDDRLAVEFLSDDAAARRACAAADFLVLTSPYDVSATWAQAAQRYGALPVARASGAHVDAIVDCDAALETGTGFLFDDATKESLLGAMGRALSAYTSPRFSALRRRVMRLDLAWDRPARRYVQVYRQAIAERGKAVAGG